MKVWRAIDVYRFEWNYDIKDQKAFDDFVSKCKAEGELVNYEQAARLFYEGKTGTVMVELQVPTKEMIDLTEEDENPWLDAYEVKDLQDYDASKEIYTGIGKGVMVTYENAEQLMLSLAKELCDEEGGSDNG